MLKSTHSKSALVAGLLTALLAGPAGADTGSMAFDRYAQDVRDRIHAINSGTYWISPLVDQGAFERYLAAIGGTAEGPAMTDTAAWLASLEVKPLRTFNGYLAYLGMRMRADAGPSGPLLDTKDGTLSFDQYVEEINYRIQALYGAEESSGF